MVGKLRASLERLSGEAEASEWKRRQKRIEEGLARWELELREAEAALVHGLGAEDPRVRVRSARVLSRYRGTDSLRLSIEVLSSAESPASASAAMSLGLPGDAIAREPLDRAAMSDDEDLGVSAIPAPQDLRAGASRPRLRELASQSRNERVAAALRYTVAILEPDVQAARTILAL